MSKLTINLGGWPIFITALLCVLKLTGIFTISWWWCFCLIWLPISIILGICILVLMFIVIVGLIIVIKNLIK